LINDKLAFALIPVEEDAIIILVAATAAAGVIELNLQKQLYCEVC
jgi:hypothetical protein